MSGAVPFRPITFTVQGTPKPQGSHNVGRNGRLYEANAGTMPWRQAVMHAARTAYKGEAISGPVSVVLTFSFSRPLTHYKAAGLGGRARTVRPTAPSLHSVKPDIDKLARAVLDALTQSGILSDDSRVSILTAHKVYCDDAKPFAHIVVTPVPS